MYEIISNYSLLNLLSPIEAVGRVMNLAVDVGSQNHQQHGATFLAQELAGVNNIVGIQVLNEPSC